MNANFEKHLKLLNFDKEYLLFRGIKRGFEKECLRVDNTGTLAKTKHPKSLGSSLMHPMITTDYSEGLLEFITPPTEDLFAPFEMLTQLHQFTYHVLEKEYLWAGSMPCNLPKEEDIPIAEYGPSNLGKLKHIYRKGLGYRYGRKMQTIAGIHYNFSLPTHFFEHHYGHSQTQMPLKNFISEQYLGLIRNGLRWGWLLALLFGASPAICKNFLNSEIQQLPFLKPWQNSFIGPFATSLRLSDLGYHNKKESAERISYNSYEAFLKTMYEAVHTSSPNFSKIGVLVDGEYRQLNNSILQLEDEYYALMRPKRLPNRGERKICALIRDGIEYIEVRALDLNPYLPLGLDSKIAHFMDVFLITCLFLDSPPLTANEQLKVNHNQHLIVTEGRKPGLKLRNEHNEEVLAIQMADHFLESMLIISGYLDQAYNVTVFKEAVIYAREILKNKETLPSALMIEEMISQKKSYFELIQYWSLEHQKTFKSLPFPMDMVQYYDNLAKTSLIEQKALEESESSPFSDYLQQYLRP